jgi:hypothetical protein
MIITEATVWITVLVRPRPLPHQPTFGSAHEHEANSDRVSVRREATEHTDMWEDNIKMDLREECMYWIHLTQDGNQWMALVVTVMNFRVP